MTIMQGDAYYLPFKLFVDKIEILPANVETIEFSLGNLLKYYPGDVEYRDECYQLYLSQQETFKLSPKSSLKVIVRIKFPGSPDVVRGTLADSINVEASTSREVL